MPSSARSARSATFRARSPPRSPQQGAATQEIARSVEIASKRTAEAAEQVGGVNEVAETTSRHATTARSVADNLGTVAARIREQVDQFFQRLNAA
jgi:methyl-accepting chemotaxis protein